MTLINGQGHMNKKYYWEILLVILSFVNWLSAKPEVIGSKVLSGVGFNASNILSAGMFIGNENDIVVAAEVPGYLWLNNKWVSTKQYGDFMNGFIKDGVIYLVFQPDEQHIDIYSVKKDIVLEQHVPIEAFPTYPGPNRVVCVSGDTSILYFLGTQEQFPRNPAEFTATAASGGHGTYYDKPVWAEIKGQTLLKYENVSYGGKTDECFLVKAVVTEKDAVHFLGFRTKEFGAESHGASSPTPVILHYAEYNTKKKEVVRVQEIYKDTSRVERGNNNERIDYFYGELSADKLNDNTAVAFSCVKRNLVIGAGGDTKITINSQVYCSCGEGGKFGEAEKIGEGLVPLARFDSTGNAHVVWVNNNGALVHRAKKDGKWGEEETILNGVDNSPSKLFGKYICAEFDKSNILNVVFLSNGNMVLEKIKFD